MIYHKIRESVNKVSLSSKGQEVNSFPYYELTSTKLRKSMPIGMIWIIIATGLVSYILPIRYGRIGFAFAIFSTAVLVLILVGPIMRSKISGWRLFGLFLLTLIFLNVDAITVALDVEMPRRYSFILLGPFIVYLIKIVPSLFYNIKRHKLVILFILFCLIQIPWSIISGTEAFLAFTQKQIFFLLVFVATVDYILSSRMMARSIAIMFVLAGITSSIMMILEYLYPDSLGMSSTILHGGLRSAGPYINAGVGAYIITSCSLILSLLVHAKILPRICLVPVLCVFLLSLYTTFSIQGAISLVLVLIAGLLAIQAGKNTRSLARLAASGIIIIVILLLFSSYLFKAQTLEKMGLNRDSYQRLSRVLQLFQVERSAIIDSMEKSQRSALISYSWTAIKRAPWFGHGSGAASHYTELGEAGFSPHNYFLLIWLENGIFMLVFILLIFISVIVNNIQSKDPERWFRILLIGNMIIFMFSRHIIMQYRYMAIIWSLLLVMDKLSLWSTKRINRLS